MVALLGGGHSSQSVGRTFRGRGGGLCHAGKKGTGLYKKNQQGECKWLSRIYTSQYPDLYKKCDVYCGCWGENLYKLKTERGDGGRGCMMCDVWRVARAEGRKRARHRAAPIEGKKRRYRDYATCAAAALPSNVKNFFSFAIRMIIYCWFVVLTICAAKLRKFLINSRASWRTPYEGEKERIEK